MNEWRQGSETTHLNTKQLLRALPQHVRDDWYAPFANINRLMHSSVSDPDSESAILAESKITKNELIEIIDLKNREAAFEMQRTRYGSRDYYLEAYKNLFTERSDRGADDALLRDALALSIVAAQEAYSSPGSEFTVWETQRIGLLRLVKNLTNPDNDGIVGDLRTGMGKTDVVAMILIPVCRLITDHVDLTSRTELTRRRNAERFYPLGNLFGLSSFQLTAQGYERYRSQGVLMGGTSKHRAVSEGDVLFTTKHDLGSYLLDRFSKGDYQTILKMKRGDRSVIIDEYDAEELDEAATEIITTGNQYPTDELILTYWDPTKYPDDLTNSENFDVTVDDFGQFTFELSSRLNVKFADAHSDIKNTIKHPSDQLLTSYVLMQQIFSFIPTLRLQNDIQPDDAQLISDNGSITLAGQEFLKRLLYERISGVFLSGQERIPNKWSQYLSVILPSHIMNVISTAATLENGRHYFVNAKRKKIDLQSEFTGWPQEGREYEPLLMLALYAKENTDKFRVLIPKKLHDIADKISPVEVDRILYKKRIGLTGSGILAAKYIRRTKNMDITAIPPEYPDRIDITNAYKPVISEASREKTYLNRAKAIADYLKTMKDPIVPVIINVSSQKEEEVLIEYLQKTITQDTFEILNAENAENAQNIIQSAGTLRTRIISRLMVSREVDIAVDRISQHYSGMHIISSEPLPLRRQENQLKGRTGRANTKGTYRCFVTERDTVFALLSDAEKRGLIRALNSNNQKKIEYYIRIGQDKHELELQEQMAHIHQLQTPIARIRESQLETAEKDSELAKTHAKAIRIFWKDFVNLVMNLRQTVPLLGNPHLNSAVRDKLWSNRVIETYMHALTTSISLLEDHFITIQDIREHILQEIMAELQQPLN